MRNRESSTESLAGSLLLAHPAMKDPNFARAVVLLSAHDEEGALGVVLNRPTGQTLGELDPVFADGVLNDISVFAGGPVQTDRLLICAIGIHPDGEGLRLHFGIEPEKAEALVEDHGDRLDLRAFMGHSGWGSGQLENELKQHTWAVSAIPSDLLLQRPNEEMWRDVISEVGPEWRLLAHEPEDAERN